MQYVSLTRLDLGSPWHIWRFMKHAIASKQDAMRADGLIRLDSKALSLKSHATMSLWQTRKHMIAFLHGPVHLAAIKDFPRIATGQVHGYESDHLPSWPQALELLTHQGRTLKNSRG